jgi:copper transport protein
VRRSLSVALVLVCVVLVLPSAASAHATISWTTPETQSTLNGAPNQVQLHFDQSVTATETAIEVFAADGTLVSEPAFQPADKRDVIARVSGLDRGSAYTVRWRATSADGHTIAGVYTFGVGVPAPPPTEAYGASGPSISDDVARWAYFVTLALLLGGLGMRLLVLRGPLPAGLERRFYALIGFAALANVNVGLLAFVLRAEDALQLSIIDLLYGDLSPIATQTRFGHAFVAMTLGFAWVFAIVALAWIFDRSVLLWPALIGTLVLASGLSLSGHSALEPNSSALTKSADWLHLVAASLWVGGVVALALCVWPVAPELRKRAFLGFARLAMVLMAAVVLAGTYLSIARLPAIADLWETTYGQVLLLKVGLVCLALAWGAVHHFVVRPRIERGRTSGAMRRSLVGEGLVALAVLLVAAVLTNGEPPPTEPAGGTEQATAADA